MKRNSSKGRCVDDDVERWLVELACTLEWIDSNLAPILYIDNQDIISLALKPSSSFKLKQHEVLIPIIRQCIYEEQEPTSPL